MSDFGQGKNRLMGDSRKQSLLRTGGRPIPAKAPPWLPSCGLPSFLKGTTEYSVVSMSLSMALPMTTPLPASSSSSSSPASVISWSEPLVLDHSSRLATDWRSDSSDTWRQNQADWKTSQVKKADRLTTKEGAYSTPTKTTTIDE